MGGGGGGGDGSLAPFPEPLLNFLNYWHVCLLQMVRIFNIPWNILYRSSAALDCLTFHGINYSCTDQGQLWTAEQADLHRRRLGLPPEETASTGGTVYMCASGPITLASCSPNNLFCLSNVAVSGASIPPSHPLPELLVPPVPQQCESVC